MAISLRHYIFQQDGSVAKIPTHTADGLALGRQTLPDFANTSQRILTVVLENEDGKPQAVSAAEGSIWHFDEQGSIQAGLRKGFFEALETHYNLKQSQGPVVPFQPKKARKEWEERNRWRPEQKHLDAVLPDIWPKIHKGEKIPLVSGATPKPPPVPHEVRRITDDFSGEMATFLWRIADLTDPSLRGLAHHLRKRAEEDRHLASVWNGFAAYVDGRCKILKDRRLGKGTWYAVLSVFERDEGSSQREVLSVEERCEGMAAADSTARKLLVDHAEQLSASPELIAPLARDPR